MPDYVPIQDLTVSTDLNDTDYVPVSDGTTTFAVRAEKFKAYSAAAAEQSAEEARIAAETAAEAMFAAVNSNTEQGFTSVDSIDQFSVASYYDITGNSYSGGNTYRTTPLLPCHDFRAMQFNVWRYNSGSMKVASIAFFNKDRQFISGIYADYMSSGESVYKGQCAIPDDAWYYCAFAKLNQSYSPKVSLYRESVTVDLTGLLTASTTIYTRQGSGTSASKWYTTQYVPVHGFKSLTFVAAAFHSGTVELESVSFFNSSGARFDGVFTNISNNNDKNGRGTVPIPPEAQWCKLLYKSTMVEQPSLTLHNQRERVVNILCIGDSLTEGITGGTTRTTDNYPINMQKALGINYTVFNAGVGGSQASTWWSSWRSYLNLKSYNTDVIIVMLGANGGMTDTFETDVDAYDDYNDYANTITGRTCSMIEWLQEQLPSAQILMVAPTYIDASIAPNNATQADRQCQNMPKFVERYHTGVIDIRNTMGINSKNSAEWLSSDGVHGTEKFYEKLGMLMASQVKPLIGIPNGGNT